MNEKSERNCRKVGFSLTEFLTVIAILLVLAAVIIPGAVSLRRNIKQHELDVTAREIYLAAQNQLTRMEAGGRKLEPSEGSTILYKPEDLPTEAKWTITNFFYTTSGTDTAALLLPLGSIDETVRNGGIYVIEYDRVNSAVYSVFYAEKKFSYDEVAGEPGFRTNLEVRRKKLVGYYGGAMVERDKFERCNEPMIEIENTDLLAATITGLEPGYRLTVMVSDGKNTVTVEYKMIESDTKAWLVLDSLDDENLRFSKLFPETSETKLIPGEDLRIIVEFSCEGKMSSSAEATVNSLFAERDGETVYVSYARHLQNLEPKYSGIPDRAKCEQLGVTCVTKAEQTAHIEWNHGISWQSVWNPELVSYNGNGQEIRSLTGENGLFSVAENMEISGVRLVNPKITGSNLVGDESRNQSQCVGVLAGQATSTKITECAVFARAVNGENKIDYPKYGDGSYMLSQKTGGVAGGLIGEAENCTITDSFAALPIIEAEETAAAGTLIGQAENCKVEHSYGACDRFSGSGMLIGNVADGTGAPTNVSSCYVVGNMGTTKELAGPLSMAPNAKIFDSYCAFSYIAEGADKGVLPTAYQFYDSTGTVNSTTKDDLEKLSLDGWNKLSAYQTHPYQRLLDGRAYPFPGFKKLEHYGSWPSDGLAEIRVKLLLESGEDGSHAGVVILKNEDGTILYQSDDPTKNEPVTVPAGEKLTVTIEENSGYEYLSTDIGGTVSTEKDLEFVVEGDTDLIVSFAQRAFELHCNEVEYAQTTLSGGDYTAYAGQEVLRPKDIRDVEKDTPIYVAVELPPSDETVAYVASVWYTYLDGTEPHEVLAQRDEKGQFWFEMPGADTELHVKFTQMSATYQVEYYLMDTDGNYPSDPTVTMERRLGIGEVINENLLSLFANESKLPVSIEKENVLYFAEGLVTRGEEDDKEKIFHVQQDSDGNVMNASTAYVTQEDDNGKTFLVKIWVDRKQYQVTLIPGENIQMVGFGNASSSQTVSDEFYYGKQVLVDARTSGKAPFTAWIADPANFNGSPNPRYEFTVPHYDVTLKAVALPNHYLVRLNLLENNEAWLKSSPSRQENDVSLELVNTEDDTKIYPLENLDSDTESYISQVVVPAVNKAGEGYYIRVNGEYYTREGKYYESNGQDDDRVILKVRYRAVEENVLFFTAEYRPNARKYSGALPKGGTYLYNHRLTIAGNVGLLSNLDDASKSFKGWSDSYVDAKPTLFVPGSTILIKRKTDFFAQWTGEKETLRVRYDANGAQRGELPTDTKNYVNGDEVPIQSGSLERDGYTFSGWRWSTSKDPVGGVVNGNVYKIGTENVVFYARWEPVIYTVQCYNEKGELLAGAQYQVNAIYGSKFTIPGYPDNANFSGWAESAQGTVNFLEGQSVTITGDLKLYAKVASNQITVSFYDSTGKISDVKVGQSVLTCLTSPAGMEKTVTGWSTEPNHGGTFYLCDENGRFTSQTSFRNDTNLYAVTGKVYNYNKKIWYNTLADAVSDSEGNAVASNGDTLVVYRDTEETRQIRFNKTLYLMSNGKNRVTWNSLETTAQPIEYSGCMLIENSTISLGQSPIPTLAMGQGNELTFDANGKGRVTAIRSGGILHMYDEITMTGGQIGRGNYECSGGKEEDSGAQDRGNFGGGVYAGAGAQFLMHGGTITQCEGVSGGGVYLYTGSKMSLGDMVEPKAYSSTAIYYEKNGDYYVNVPNVTPENYKRYYVTAGNPVISYNTASRKASGGDVDDGGGGLMMVDLNNGDLVLYRGVIMGNQTDANGGGIMTDGGHNTDFLRIYEVEISHNIGNDGGGLFQWQGTLYIYNSVIRQNYATTARRFHGNGTGKGRGGGIFLRSYAAGETSDIEFYFGDIADNQSDGNGGAVYGEANTNMKMFGGSLHRNSSSGGNGGGVYLEYNSSYRKTANMFLSGGSIHDNMSSDKQNDVYLAYGYYNNTWGNREYIYCFITVPEDRGGLSLTHSRQAGDSQVIVVDCQKNNNSYMSGWNIVRYQQSEDFKIEDADEFSYQGEYTNLFVVPNENARVQELGAYNNQRTVKFDPMGGNMGSPSAETKSKIGDEIGVSSFPNVTRAGYYLAGWALSPNADPDEYVIWRNPEDDPNGKLEGSYKVTALWGQTLYAMWESYTLTYDLNAAHIVDVAAPPMEQGPNIIISAPTKNQYMDGEVTKYFHGWSTDRNAAEAEYKVGDSLFLEKDTTLYAVWKDTESTALDVQGE